MHFFTRFIHLKVDTLVKRPIAERKHKVSNPAGLYVFCPGVSHKYTKIHNPNSNPPLNSSLSRLQPHPIDIKILPRHTHKLQPFPNHHPNINFSAHLSLPIILPPRTTTCPQKATTKTQAASDIVVTYHLLSSHITIRAEQLEEANIRNFVGKKEGHYELVDYRPSFLFVGAMHCS